ncbi:type II toxin-antitoxin system VapC family toxin [Goodfellowiella coeruleoviolacea]|uniref:Nucleic acid-binding protein, contains PIN domain n=1 Tax=Goodfellowiella coeruleoviolacea TaxID=334858 RepID=A0AAE3GD53_9PSEU|nr:type II toxin-antitoxin system VapC family toxin [Goodfellowiella coeruleoviolacea]MCP2166082.1 putative nucleic acid-binding protein, contains PIN domain [Goodfellowiella coeruleoviolacea]
MRVYLDSSALLKRVIDEPESEKLRVVLRGHVDERAVLLSSQLAWIEVSWAIRARFGSGYATAADFVDDAMSGVAEYPVGDEVVSLSQRLNPNRLRSLDAIHVASAMLLDVDLLITYDDRMADAAQQNGLRCTMPGR